MREAQLRSWRDRLLRRPPGSVGLTAVATAAPVASAPSVATAAPVATAPSVATVATAASVATAIPIASGPINAAAVPVAVIAAPSVPAPIAVGIVAPAKAGPPSFAPARVLLFTSDRRFRALASTLLSQRGHVVIVSCVGDDIGELAEREQADVVLLDASSSLTTAARQAARLGSLRTPVGIVAVSADSECSLAALPVLAKWSSFDEVLTAVDRACATARRAA